MSTFYILLTVITACGRTLQESIGQFSHAPTPQKEELCQWRISATHGEKIVLNISALDIPVTGRHDDGEQCDTDYLEVRDGHYVMSKLIGKFIKIRHFSTVEPL